MTEINEENIKDILYETTMREYLTQEAKPARRLLLYRIASAAVVILVAGFFLAQNLGKGQNDGDLVAEVYEFPIPNKSRSSEKSIGEQQLELLEEQKYQEALVHFNNDSLSLSDLYTKANIYFALDSFEAMERVVEQLRSETDLYDDQLDWILFLDAYKAGLDSHVLKKMANNLAPQYQDEIKAYPFFD